MTKRDDRVPMALTVRKGANGERVYEATPLTTEAMRKWALRCAFDERDVAWINSLYPAPAEDSHDPK